MQAHALTPRTCATLDEKEEPRFPFPTFLVSGRAYDLLLSEGLTRHNILAEMMGVAMRIWWIGARGWLCLQR